MSIKVNNCARQLELSDMSNIESMIGGVLPNQYKNFLLQFNGGRPESSVFKIEGLENNPVGKIQVFLGIDREIESSNIDWNYDVFKGRVPSDILPIARTGTGDLICIGIKENKFGKIYFWDMVNETNEYDYSNVYYLRNSFDEFIADLYLD